MVAGITRSEKTVAGSGASRTIQNQISKPTKFSEVNDKYQQEYKSIYNHLYGEAEYVKVMNGEKQLNDSEINSVVTAYNNLHSGMRTNTSTAQIKDVNGIVRDDDYR